MTEQQIEKLLKEQKKIHWHLTGCWYGLCRITEVRKKEFLSGDLQDLELIIQDINYMKDAFKFFKVDCLKDLLKKAMKQTKDFIELKKVSQMNIN